MSSLQCTKLIKNRKKKTKNHNVFIRVGTRYILSIPIRSIRVTTERYFCTCLYFSLFSKIIIIIIIACLTILGICSPNENSWFTDSGDSTQHPLQHSITLVNNVDWYEYLRYIINLNKKRITILLLLLLYIIFFFYSIHLYIILLLNSILYLHVYQLYFKNDW